MKPPHFTAKYSQRAKYLKHCLVALGICVLTRSNLHGQVFVLSPNNTIPGTTYFSDATEIAGNVFVDGYLYSANVSIGNIFASGDLYAGNIFVDNLFSYNMANISNIVGGLEFVSDVAWSGNKTWGIASTWFHSSMDFGDLTYTGTDTPAFNISQAWDGSSFNPIINQTGYDSNTTWVWQQGGLNATSNSTLPALGSDDPRVGHGNLTAEQPHQR